MDNIEQGANAGRQIQAESANYTDARTGVEITQLTRSRSHDHHLYFTTDSWYNAGEQLIFSSDRTGSPNLYSLNLQQEEITQLTDLPWEEQSSFHGVQFPFQFASLDPTGSAAYFWWNDTLLALKLNDLTIRPMYTLPSGYLGDVIRPTANGTHLITSIYEDLTDDIPADIGFTPFRRTGVGFNQIWRRRPHSKVVEIRLEDGEVNVLHEEDYWIAHVNPSPTRKNILTFAHYGPWTEIDHRVWCLDRSTGEVWQIRSKASDGTPSPPTMHEYWLADGNRLGYYGFDGANEPIFGTIRYDDTTQNEWALSVGSEDMLPHFHSRTTDLIVGDGDLARPYIMVWRMNASGSALQGPRALAIHQSSLQVQAVHPHPRMDSDGSRVIWTSDRSGYANVYLADIPHFSDLLTFDEIPDVFNSELE